MKHSFGFFVFNAKRKVVIPSNTALVLLVIKLIFPLFDLDPSLLQTEYRPSSASREYGLGGGGEGGRHLGEAGQHLGEGEEECFQSLQRKSILKNKPNCDTSPDLIPHHDNGE